MKDNNFCQARRSALHRASIGWWIGLGIIPLTAVSCAWASEPKDAFTVTYLSSELVYLNGGTDAGLAIGDRGIIRQKDSAVVEIEVAYVASHSSSGRILRLERDVQVGDTVHITARADRPMTPPGPEASSGKMTTDQAAGPKSAALKPGGTRLASLGGSVYLLYNRWDDRQHTDLGFRQANVSLNLQARRIAGTDLTLTVRTSGYRDQQNRPFGQSNRGDEWSSRISALFLTYSAVKVGLTIQGGRMAATRVGGIGFIDGLLIEQRASEHFAVGALGGAQPRWQYSDNIMSLERAGVYLSYNKGNYRTTMIEATLAALGEYHHATLSREVLYTQERLSIGDRFSLMQNSEIDVNRGWRHQRAGEQFTLTSFYINGRYRLTSWWAAGMTYDDRKNYWTYEIRTLADSLFDDHFRQGLHTQWDFTLPARIAASASVGVRGLSTAPDKTYSYTASLRKSGLWNSGSTIDWQGAGFSGSLEDGYDLSSHLGQYIRGRNYISVGAGQYGYKGAGQSGVHRVNRWVEGSVRVDLLRHLSVSTEYRYSKGNDVNGQRIQTSLSYIL